MAIYLINFYKDTLNLFSEMDFFTFALFLLGLFFVILEIFIPYNQKFFIVGCIFYLFSMCSRFLQGGNLIMIFGMVFLFCILFCGMYIINVYFEKKAWLEKSSSLSVNCYFVGNKSTYNFLLGLQGITISNLEPEGLINIRGYTFLAVSKSNELIDKGVSIIVVDVEGNKIFVAQNSIKQ